MRKVLTVAEDGETVTGLYDDALAARGAVLEVSRASHVEYAQTPGVKGWEIVLSDDPRNGVFKGHVLLDADTAVLPAVACGLAAMGRYKGFTSRAEALAVEVEFLGRYVLGAQSHV